MINAYKDGKDLYSVIASMSFEKSYEDCLEFYPEGTVITLDGKDVVCGKKTHTNVSGKEYRNQSKKILLGLLYGRGAKAIGEQIGKSLEEAQAIIDKFFKAFPKVKQWIDYSHDFAHKYGYVEDIVGRRRRLPNIQLPTYNIVDKGEQKTSFNPLLGSKKHIVNNGKVEKYKTLLSNAKYKKDIDKIISDASRENIVIESNNGFIAEAERQAVNARVQGGAATITKFAMIRIFNDQRLKDLGAYLINTVHDEILIEVPEENSELAAKYLSEDMVESAKVLVPDVPMQCDTYNVTHWYEDEYSAVIKKKYKELQEKDMGSAYQNLCETYTELTKEQLDNMLTA